MLCIRSSIDRTIVPDVPHELSGQVKCRHVQQPATKYSRLYVEDVLFDADGALTISSTTWDSWNRDAGRRQTSSSSGTSLGTYQPSHVTTATMCEQASCCCTRSLADNTSSFGIIIGLLSSPTGRLTSIYLSSQLLITLKEIWWKGAVMQRGVSSPYNTLPSTGNSIVLGMPAVTLAVCIQEGEGCDAFATKHHSRILQAGNVILDLRPPVQRPAGSNAAQPLATPHAAAREQGSMQW